MLKRIRNRLQKAFRDFLLEKYTFKKRVFPNDFTTYRQWFELNFTPEINWGNFGKVWQIDHVAPLWLFDLPKETFIAFYYFNLLPRTEEDNRFKGGSVEYAIEYYTRLKGHYDHPLVDDILKRCKKAVGSINFTPAQIAFITK